MRFFLPPAWPGSLLEGARRLDALAPSFFPPTSAALPALNVWTEDEVVHVQAEIPGLTRDDIELTVLGAEFTLAGERRIDHGKDSRLLHGERRFGKFRRVVQLPFPIESEGVSAALEKGVLTVTLPRAEADRPRRIPLQASED